MYITITFNAIKVNFKYVLNFFRPSLLYWATVLYRKYVCLSSNSISIYFVFFLYLISCIVNNLLYYTPLTYSTYYPHTSAETLKRENIFFFLDGYMFNCFY